MKYLVCELIMDSEYGDYSASPVRLFNSREEAQTFVERKYVNVQVCERNFDREERLRFIRRWGHRPEEDMIAVIDRDETAFRRYYGDGGTEVFVSYDGVVLEVSDEDGTVTSLPADFSRESSSFFFPYPPTKKGEKKEKSNGKEEADFI